MSIHPIIGLLICIATKAMKVIIIILRIDIVIAYFALCVLTASSQKEAETWLRVVTEEDFFIDVNRLSLRFEPNRVISVKIRTILSQEESLPESSKLKYRTRLDSIQFNLKDRKYRVFDSTFLDSSGQTVLLSSSHDSNSWKSFRGGTGSRVFSAIDGLPPFGVWNAISYRYGSGELPSDDDPPELKSLVGINIKLDLYGIQQIGKVACSTPVFEPWKATDEEVQKRLGISFKSIGLSEDKLEAVLMSCERRNEGAAQTFILLLPNDRAIMLWEGVFLEMERVMRPFPPMTIN